MKLDVTTYGVSLSAEEKISYIEIWGTLTFKGGIRKMRFIRISSDIGG